MAEEYEDWVIYDDELQLLDWEDSSRAGMTVRFRIPVTESEAHPFKRFAIGTRFFARMMEIGDDDKPIDQTRKEQIRQAIQEREMKGGRLARDAGILCGDPTFHEFVVTQLLNANDADKRALAAEMPAVFKSALKEQKFGVLDDPRVAGEIAKWWVYSRCRIKSRRELDHKQDAANRYELFVCRPFYASQERAEVIKRGET